jgi:hypothetical protein
MTYKTGSIGEFMRWTKQVVTDPVAAKDTPKRWFDTEETAAKSLGTSDSPEAMVKLLSAETQGAGEPTREIAEAELDLWRIRKIRAMLFDTYYVAKILVPDRLMQLNDKLAKLERYERRAFSRRKRALRALQ